MALPAGEGSHVEGMGQRHPQQVTHRRSPTGRDRLKQMSRDAQNQPYRAGIPQCRRMY